MHELLVHFPKIYEKIRNFSSYLRFWRGVLTFLEFFSDTKFNMHSGRPKIRVVSILEK